VNAQSMRDSQQGVEADPLLPAFDLADVNGMQICFFREPLLAQAKFGAVFTYSFTKNFELLSRRPHSLPKNQEPMSNVFYYADNKAF
jgi:hypothetical protein